MGYQIESVAWMFRSVHTHMPCGCQYDERTIAGSRLLHVHVMPSMMPLPFVPGSVLMYTALMGCCVNSREQGHDSASSLQRGLAYRKVDILDGDVSNARRRCFRGH